MPVNEYSCLNSCQTQKSRATENITRTAGKFFPIVTTCVFSNHSMRYSREGRKNFKKEAGEADTAPNYVLMRNSNNAG